MPYTPRKEIRVPLKGNIVYSVGFATQGGTVKDISMHGCLVESDRPPHPASMLSCRILLPGLSEPLEIQLALVQWVLGNHFGLKIMDMSGDSQKRLRRFLEDNYVLLARAKRGRGQARMGSATSPRSVIADPESGADVAGSPCEGRLSLPDSESPADAGCLEDPVAILPHDLSAFVGWILDARHAFEEKVPLPAPPMLEFEEFKACTQFIQTLLDQSQAAESRSADSSSRVHLQQEVTQGEPPQPGDNRQPADAVSDQHSPVSEDARPERRVRTRRSGSRANKPSPLPLSVRLSRLTAKLKLPCWFARA